MVSGNGLFGKMAAPAGTDVQILEINDPNIGQHIKSEWGIGNSILVYSTSDHRSKVAGHEPHIDVKPSHLYDVRWDFFLNNAHSRKLVSESNGVFVGLQKMVSEKKSDVGLQLVKCSRKYRSIAKAFVNDLQQEADAASDDSRQCEFEAQWQPFEKIELIWNLCEVLFLVQPTGGALLTQLLDWIRWHFPECDILAREVTQSKEPASHPSYWNAIYGYALQGRVDDARRLLQLHPDSHGDVFQSVDRIMRKMPFHSYFAPAMVFDFIYQWQQWHDDCAQRLKHGEFHGCSPLEKLCNLLCGTLETYLEVRDVCETWYHMMVSRLLYTNPCVKATDLQYVAYEYVDLCGGMTVADELDQILLAVLEFNVLEVIKQSSQHFESWWFAAHLTDLFYHAGVLLGEPESTEKARNLHHFLILEYASSLASYPGMWQFAVDYFDHCSIGGRLMLETYLEKVPLTSERVATQVLYVARQRDFHELVRSICRVMGQQALHNKRYGTALSWALKSKDASFVTYLADHFLSEYSHGGLFHGLDLLGSLGSSMLVSDRLAFLCKYREFHELYSNKNFRLASNVLVQLLTSRLAPKSFCKPLLLDAIPLLESDEVVLDTEQTYELLHCLEEATAGSENGGSADNTGLDASQEQLIRLALARNLARTFTL